MYFLGSELHEKTSVEQKTRVGAKKANALSTNQVYHMYYRISQLLIKFLQLLKTMSVRITNFYSSHIIVSFRPF